MSFASELLSDLDEIRTEGGELGLRPFLVTIRRRVWTGIRPGLGAKDYVDTILANYTPYGSSQPVMVRQLTRAEVFASGGAYASRDLKVGPMTPAYAASILNVAGGVDDSILNPAVTSGPQGGATQLIWIVSSPSGTYGIPAGGVVCELKGEEATAFHYYCVLRSTGRAPT